MTEHEVAVRFRIAQSWWIASELARRNPHIFVYEWHPAGGTYDCLGLIDDRAPTDGALIDLNRVGRLHALKPEQSAVATWEELHSTSDAHAVVKRLETQAGLVPGKNPRTTPRALSYRIIARALTALVNERHVWDARSLNHDTSAMWPDDRRPWMDPFPTARELTRGTRLPTLGWWAEPWSHFWALVRDDEPVLLIDVHGTVHHADGRTVDLMETYRAHSRSIGATLAAATGDLLP